MKVRALKKKTVVYAFIFILVIALLAAGFVFISRWSAKRNSVNPEDISSDQNETIVINNKTYVKKTNLDSILLIGIDQFNEDEIVENNRNNRLNDFNMLVVIDNDAKNYTAVQINRDTLAYVHALNERGEDYGTEFVQIAFAHSFGSGGKDSCINTVNTVSDYLYGAEIKHYASFTMEAIPVLNDLVGGVTVKCISDFSAQYPEMTEGATVTLKGQQALDYIRARKSMADPTNIARMERQRQYLDAFRAQLASNIDVNEEFISTAFKKLADEIVTDCTVSQLSRLYDKAKDYEFIGILTPKGESVKGDKYMEFTADDADLRQIIADTYYTPVD